MEFQQLVNKAKEIKERYAQINQKSWGATEHTQGLVGDVGDLMKLIMAKDGLRMIDSVDEKIKHELSDCLWSVLVIADDLGINLEDAFMIQMDKLKERIDREGR